MKSYFKSKRHVIIFSIFFGLIVLTTIFFFVTAAEWAANGTPSTDDSMKDPLFVISLVLFICIPFTLPVFIFDLVTYFIDRKKAKKAEQAQQVVVQDVKPVEVKAEEAPVKEQVIESSEESQPIRVFNLESKERHSYKFSLLLTYFAYFTSCLAIFFCIAVIVTCVSLMLNLNSIEGMLLPTLIGTGAAFAFSVILFFLLSNSIHKGLNGGKVSNLSISVHDDYILQEFHQEKSVNGLTGDLKYKLYFDRIKTMSTKKYFLIKSIINRNVIFMALDKNTDEGAIEAIVSRLKELKIKK